MAKKRVLLNHGILSYNKCVFSAMIFSYSMSVSSDVEPATNAIHLRRRRKDNWMSQHSLRPSDGKR